MPLLFWANNIYWKTDTKANRASALAIASGQKLEIHKSCDIAACSVLVTVQVYQYVYSYGISTYAILFC